MQVNFNGKENQFKVPHYKVGDEVLAFSYISGKFFIGTISAVTSYADNNQSVVNYAIKHNRMCKGHSIEYEIKEVKHELSNNEQRLRSN